MNHEKRIARTGEALDGSGIDALLVTNLTNVRYLTGFSGTNGQVLIARSGAWFFSDPRYAARAGALVQGAEVGIYPNRLTELLPERVKAEGVARLGLEAAAVTLTERDQLEEELSGIELVPCKDIIEDHRRTKDPDEIAALRRAVEIGDETFDWLLGRLRPGITERAVALDLEVHMRTTGADAISFDPIVGSGPLSAHIHHTPSDRTLRDGDLVLLDFGSLVDGYCSDLTRTVVLGPATDTQRETYALVLAAQERGIAAARAGARCVDVDAAARAVIGDAGHAQHFGHGLGHGVGLDIHEAPRLHRTSEEQLRSGDVVTVEPGVYVLDSGGIRIEDCVLVTEDEADVLTKAPKNDLLEVG